MRRRLRNKILIASNLLDPITPLPAAETVAVLLGQDAVLIRENGFGIFSAYMTNGTLLANGTVCEVDATFECLAGVNIQTLS
ncbi:hypothetical protein K466DRAFT_606538 [Polyporus arcularius HHB13444]|uniref:Peptidase S33 tripeptidyl aminopeptidase-like C-terminal domain-containing protein n=1 Tax=Polyporus arcularius HHB13444 TaxID=1314778 RepID=A0A5C3NMN4_9APHY|nr:hypothetical protein K466DRAFT_606538 [Polyporus arcularius HHB13444]